MGQETLLAPGFLDAVKQEGAFQDGLGLAFGSLRTDLFLQEFNGGADDLREGNFLAVSFAPKESKVFQEVMLGRVQVNLRSLHKTPLYTL